MLTKTQQGALLAVAGVAVEIESKTMLPAPLLISQWAAESGWGEKQTGDFNFWGLTRAAAAHMPQKLCPTHELLTQAEIDKLPADERNTITKQVPLPDGKFHVEHSRHFPNFPSLQAAAECYAELITRGKPYMVAWNSYRLDRDLEKLIDGVTKAVFATGSGYAILLKRIAHQANVTVACDTARAKAA
jgi:flagellum-specific peptidoglycan hydrolase FlgJ